MRTPLPLLALLALGAPRAPALAASHPPGVPYPLRAAALQPTGLAQQLPSTRRYVLVWQDQLIPDGYTAAQRTWVVTHFVGTQKLFQRQIDAYRAENPGFLMLVYHLAYGLNGADQPNPVGNITSPNGFGQEDTDAFTPWVTSRAVTRENAYQHTGAPASVQTRVSYPDPYWLMDIAAPEWTSYLADTLVAWAAFPTAQATGIFFDVAFPPWFNYSPNDWWAGPSGDGSRQGLLAWWNPRASAYFDGLRTQLAPSAAHARYLVIPNPDALVDSIDEPAFLDATDGVFTENWQSILASPGDWNLSVRRISRYVTGQAKVWMADVTQPATALAQADRELLVGTFLLIRNGTSYLMFGNGALAWYPEYEIDLGGYLAEPPADLEQLRIAGSGGASGGLYERRYVAGTVVVNSSATALTYQVATPLQRAAWSGGGPIGSDATQAPQSLDYSGAVAAGPISVPGRSVLVLRAPGGPPPPGVEPGDLTDAGPDAGADAGTDAGSGGDGGSGGAPGGTAVAGSCGCSTGSGAAAVSWPLFLLALSRRGRAPRRAPSPPTVPARAPSEPARPGPGRPRSAGGPVRHRAAPHAPRR
jgi:hypothetical protein